MRRIALALGLTLALAGLAGPAPAEAEGPDRSVLPIPRATAASVAAKTLEGSTPHGPRRSWPPKAPRT